jgi:hypothetical protein
MVVRWFACTRGSTAGLVAGSRDAGWSALGRMRRTL